MDAQPRLVLQPRSLCRCSSSNPPDLCLLESECTYGLLEMIFENSLELDQK